MMNGSRMLSTSVSICLVFTPTTMKSVGRLVLAWLPKNDRSGEVGGRHNKLRTHMQHRRPPRSSVRSVGSLGLARSLSIQRVSHVGYNTGAAQHTNPTNAMKTS